MREVFLVAKDKKNKAEDTLKKDDLISRQSIHIREANALGIEEDGYFIIIDGSEEAIKKAEELLKELGKRYKKKKDVLKKFDESENKAIEGAGFILGKIGD